MEDRDRYMKRRLDDRALRYELLRIGQHLRNVLEELDERLKDQPKTPYFGDPEDE